MPTRTTTDPDADRPEKYASHRKVAGLNTPLNLVIRAARARSEDIRRAMLWLANYARLQDTTTDALAEVLALDRAAIRDCLLNPEAEGINAFVRQVKQLRTTFEREQRPLAPTRICKLVRKAARFAAEKRQAVEIIGKWRSGKTVSAREAYLPLLDRAAWLHCPSDESEHSFIFSLAAALGLGTSTSYSPKQLRPKILSCFGPGGIDLLFVDEAHFLWPINAVRKRLSRPRRLEFIREIHDTAGIGIVLLTTPQHAELLHQCIQSNELWAPGQWDGRAQPFLLPEALDDADLEAIARWHGPDLADEAIAPLLAMAKSSEGYLGKMVKAIERARFFYASGGTIRAADILSAQRSMEESNLSLRRKLK